MTIGRGGGDLEGRYGVDLRVGFPHTLRPREEVIYYLAF